MPFYDFKCQDCKQIFELMLDKPQQTKACIFCGGLADKQPSAPAVRFVGSGWMTPTHEEKQ